MNEIDNDRDRTPAGIDGPSVSTIVLGLVCLAVAVLVIVYQVGGFTLDWSLAGPGAVIAIGGVLILIGLVTLVRRRGDS